MNMANELLKEADRIMDKELEKSKVTPNQLKMIENARMRARQAALAAKRGLKNAELSGKLGFDAVHKMTNTEDSKGKPEFRNSKDPFGIWNMISKIRQQITNVVERIVGEFR